ncbi:MAG: hypothetical protein IPP94_11330 [Ignavibacteria bacterium]|nr:hypothetical protein [Ignavibacteria bacterium]
MDATNFPFIRGRACVTDKQGNPVMTVRPSDVMLFEKKGGDRAPGILRAFRPADDCYIFEGFIDNSTPQDNAHKQRSFVLTVGIPNPSGQDEEEVTITLPVPDPGTETGNDNGKPNTAYKVQHGAGWQLVSMPVMLANSRVNSVFGDGSVRSALFGFDTERGYISTDALTFGKGYWLRFAGTGEGRVNGTERTIFEVRGLPGVGQAPADGWNLIGGISYDVPLSAITQSPANAIISLFEFNNGYKPATVLKPGLGYWVKLRADASLRLVKPFTGERGGGASKISGSQTPHDGVLASIPRSATLTVSDASGSRAELFFAPASAIERLGSDERVAAELPPAPPTTAFDARFASDFSFAADQGAATLRLQGSPPWVLAFDGSAGDAGTWEVSFSDGAFIASIDARSGGNASIPRPFDGTSSARILLRKSTPAQAAPSAFVLGQNYPNPFSVSATSAGAGTRITYEIASEENVTITVYDALGRAVRGLVRRTMTPGRYTTFWDGRDESGYEVPAGSYLYELRAGAVRRTNHMIVVK